MCGMQIFGTAVGLTVVIWGIIRERNEPFAVCDFSRGAIVCTANGRPGNIGRKYDTTAVHDVWQSAAEADMVEGRRGACTYAEALLHCQ